ncbi:MAG: tetratricopeptide repeat protein [Deltaproteobacteria bacterium]|nr:tetratricopeptide repeat protein [Deltaproteobacteria bacterium]
MRRFFNIILFLSIMVILLSTQLSIAEEIFTDDFNRADGEVGNGWEVVKDEGVEVRIQNNEVLIGGTQQKGWFGSGIRRKVKNFRSVKFNFRADDVFRFIVRVTDSRTKAYLHFITRVRSNRQFNYINSPDGRWVDEIPIGGENPADGTYTTIELLRNPDGTFQFRHEEQILVERLGNYNLQAVDTVFIYACGGSREETGSAHIDNVRIGDAPLPDWLSEHKETPTPNLKARIAEYEKALEKNPDDVPLRQLLAEAYREAGELDKAVLHLDKAVELHPMSFTLHRDLANAYRDAGQIEMAIIEMEAAIIAESQLELHEQLAKLYMLDNRPIRAIAEQLRIIDWQPDRLEHRLTLRDYYRQLAEKVTEEIGFIRDTRWWTIGPFDNTDGAGFDAVYPPENEVDLKATYKGKAEDVKWRKHDDGTADELLDFTKTMQPNKNAVVYVSTHFYASDEQEAQLRLGSNDGVKVWLNGALIWSNDVIRDVKADDDIVSVNLLSGKNQLLVKVMQVSGGWGLMLRMTAAEGKPLKWISDEPY